MSGQLIVFAEDESHLLWGDTTGYVWGQRNERTEVPIQNIKARQTYYGALDLYNKEFFLTPSDKGNGENTVAFIERLQALHPDQQLMVIWDGASYHSCEEVRAYLEEVNKGLEENDWRVTCLVFAPNAPDQNPVEDVWLKGKNFLRRHFYANKTFNQVRDCFVKCLNNQIFNFNKIEWYLALTEPQAV
ncbi:MAG: transposase [Gammaproteobacteria bacterium]